MKSSILNNINTHQEVISKMLRDESLIHELELIINLITEKFKIGKKLLLCGNGGSAADAQHIAAEFTGKFLMDRPPLNAEALHVNSSYITAVSNDIGFYKAYVRALCAKADEGDVLIAISTSGSSENIIKTIEKAKELGVVTVGLTGKQGAKMKELCEHCIIVPSDIVPRIQEAHILLGHIICEQVEKNMFA